MGHVLFILMHAAAALFFAFALFITIPLHVLYAAMSGRRAPAADVPSPLTHVRCPDCKEFVQNEASKCRFCGATLVPQSVIFEQQRRQRAVLRAQAPWWQRPFL
jgi:hypothetical protein